MPLAIVSARVAVAVSPFVALCLRSERLLESLAKETHRMGSTCIICRRFVHCAMGSQARVHILFPVLK